MVASNVADQSVETRTHGCDNAVYIEGDEDDSEEKVRIELSKWLALVQFSEKRFFPVSR